MLKELKFGLLLIISVFLAACVRNLAPTLTPTTPLRLLPTEPTSRPSPTPGPLEIASTIFADLSIENQRLYSPDGRCTWDRLQAWPHEEASQQKYAGNFYIRATLTCIRGEENKEVNWLLVDEWKEAGLGYSIPALLGWSADGNYLYFYDDIIPDGCQPPGGFQDNLRRVDLDSWDVRQVLSGSFSGLSLSPDTTRLAYYDIQHKSIGTHTLVSGETHTFPFTDPAPVGEWWLTNFTWSPELSSLLFVVVYGDACYPGGSSIQMLDLESGSLDELYSSPDQTLSILEWDDPARVQIWVDPDLYWLDPVSGALLP